MNVITCSGCGERSVVFPSQIVGISNDEAGITVRYECWCGTENAVLSGRAHRETVAA